MSEASCSGFLNFIHSIDFNGKICLVVCHHFQWSFARLSCTVWKYHKLQLFLIRCQWMHHKRLCRWPLCVNKSLPCGHRNLHYTPCLNRVKSLVFSFIDVFGVLQGSCADDFRCSGLLFSWFPIIPWSGSGRPWPRDPESQMKRRWLIRLQHWFVSELWSDSNTEIFPAPHSSKWMHHCVLISYYLLYSCHVPQLWFYCSLSLIRKECTVNHRFIKHQWEAPPPKFVRWQWQVNIFGSVWVFIDKDVFM